MYHCVSVRLYESLCGQYCLLFCLDVGLSQCAVIGMTMSEL